MKNFITKKYRLIAFAMLFSGSVALAAPGGKAFKDGKSYYEQSNYGKAIEAFEKSLSENPEHYAGKSNYMIALCYKKMGECNKAAIFFKKALEGDPDKAGASSMTKFEEQLSDCGLSKATLANISATATATSTAAAGKDPFLHEYETQIANGNKLVDLTGAFTAEDKELVEKQISVLENEYKLQVRVAVSKEAIGAPESMLNSLQKAGIAAGGSHLVVLVAGDKIYADGTFDKNLVRTAKQNAEPEGLKASASRSAQGLMAEKFLTQLTEKEHSEQKSKNATNWGLWIFGLAAIGGGVYWVISRRKKVAEETAQQNSQVMSNLSQIQDVLFNDSMWLEYSARYDMERVQQVQTSLQLEYSNLVNSLDPVGVNDLEKRVRQLQNNPDGVFKALGQ
ncbi:Tetratricopeptide repeat-containing protein [Flexibacter flexilis DSM 6793]|uniref:Tetratricopeptide repeat-containing protein n=1 Tax=Flexibacter flexilis DSM 6793 TaxID=927664 RepID=A0A1I1K6T7_9BACT|nr:tetratricopeptide repeat protein [Flexibacter flexilis]SFC53240.1 Tetratricopeptide repeat-containing protein [Flexibacter flexilis DSM 6793]